MKNFFVLADKLRLPYLQQDLQLINVRLNHNITLIVMQGATQKLTFSIQFNSQPNNVVLYNSNKQVWYRLYRTAMLAFAIE